MFASRIATALTVVVALLWTSSPAQAQDFYKGELAFGRGDYAVALREYRPLAERGHAHAMLMLARMYGEGLGVPQDYTESFRLLGLAAEGGLVSAQYRLAQEYKFGGFALRGVPQNYEEAARWYRLAAEQGHCHAAMGLGNMYRFGEGVPQDYVTAHKWYNLSGAMGCERGYGGIDKQMTPAEIAEAQRLATEWFAAHR